ncbi:MAG TPA: hypothetical protein VL354_04575 [Spirochaetia bacterium]|nr:hypothetical protein [Spirochaetia bacterium]
MTFRALKAHVLLCFLLLASLLVAGCDAFFGFNLLKGLDKAPPPNPSTYDYATNGSAGLDKLSNDLNSPAVVDSLIADPTATTTIENNLKTTYTDPTVPVQDQQLAAALYGDVNLKTTSGETVVNNAVQVSLSGTNNQNVTQILQQIVPANVAADPTLFSNMANGLLNAEAAYIALGNSFPAPVSPAEAPPGVNMGDVAQKAAVAWTMQCVVTAVQNGPPAFPTQQATIDQLYLIDNNQATTTVTVPNPFSPAPSWLQNIFTVAGAKLPS